MSKTNSTKQQMSADALRAFEQESAAIWEEARKPYFDWSSIPLTYISSTTDTVAWCRCHGHPDLKECRAQTLKSVLSELDTMLTAAGFAKEGKAKWRKGGRVAPLAAESNQGKNAGLIRRDETVNSDTGFFAQWRKKLTPTKSNWIKTAASHLPNPANYLASSVYLELQRDREGACFYLNAGIRPGGLHLAYSNALAAQAAGSIVDGYYVFRPVHFTPDLPTTLKPDPFYYMQLQEDARFRPFMRDLIENRILPCLSAWAEPTFLKPPLPSEMTTKHPLKI